MLLIYRVVHDAQLQGAGCMTRTIDQNFLYPAARLLSVPVYGGVRMDSNRAKSGYDFIYRQKFHIRS
jgi:hypothetical protein